MDTPAADIDTATLVAGLRRGDADAETALFERFSRRIRLVALRYLRSGPAADDVQSETLLRVIRALRDGKLREAAALPGFVLQTARNVIRELARQDRRFVSLDEPDAGLPEPAAPIPDDPVEPVVAAALRVAAGQLGARDRLFLRLHYCDELPRAEIARRLGISEERVRLVKSRALQRFRDAYREAVPRGLDTPSR
jgi:RNA polymerase sigma factor (sigma-70 family)